MSESTTASAPADWATWTPRGAPEDEGNAAYLNRCALSAGRGRGSASPRGRGIRSGRAGSHMAPAVAHHSTTTGSHVKPSDASTTGLVFDAKQPELPSCNSPLEGSIQESQIKRSPPATVTLSKPPDQHHRPLRKTRICTPYAEKQFCQQRNCCFVHIRGEDARLVLAEANGNRPCPLVHSNRFHMANCAFKHDLADNDGASIDMVLASDVQASEASFSTSDEYNVKPSFWKSKQCANYRKEQKCPTYDCMFAHVVGEDAGLLLSLVRRNRACPFQHKQGWHRQTCGYRHDQPMQQRIMMPDHSMPASRESHTSRNYEHVAGRADDTYTVSEASERGSHDRAGRIDPDVAISHIVLCALVLLWATLAGI